MPDHYPYPPKATNSVWQRKKTISERAKVKTGLGQKLSAAEKAWNALPWSVIDLTSDEVEKIKDLKVAQAKYEKLKKVPDLSKAAKQALEDAKEDAEKTAKHKDLSEATRQAASAIAENLELAEAQLKYNLDMAKDVTDWLDSQVDSLASDIKKSTKKKSDEENSKQQQKQLKLNQKYEEQNRQVLEKLKKEEDLRQQEKRRELEHERQLRQEQLEKDKLERRKLEASLQDLVITVNGDKVGTASGGELRAEKRELWIEDGDWEVTDMEASQWDSSTSFHIKARNGLKERYEGTMTILKTEDDFPVAFSVK